MNGIQMILVTLVAALAGMGSVIDERQTHRPLIACTLIGLVLGDVKTGIILGKNRVALPKNQNGTRFSTCECYSNNISNSW